jgi:hypothetical protein
MVELARYNVVETTAEQPNIFISYARSDGAELAEELVSGLELASFRPFLDRHDIAAAEDWEARLGALILSADTIVFILSPAAVRSERCAWEVERAAQLGKRLIPVQGIPVPESEVPEQLRRLNYIFFRQGQSFARPLRELVTARPSAAARTSTMTRRKHMRRARVSRGLADGKVQSIAFLHQAISTLEDQIVDHEPEAHAAPATAITSHAHNRKVFVVHGRRKGRARP